MKKQHSLKKTADNKTPNSSLLTPPYPLLTLLPFLCLLLFVSCAGKNPVAFEVQSPGLMLYGLSREAAGGALVLSKTKTCRYVFERPLSLSAASLKIEYSFSVPPGEELKNSYQLIWETGQGTSWVLPWDLSFISPGESGTIFAYAVPLGPSDLEGFSISLVPLEGRGSNKRIFSQDLEAPRLIIKSLGFEKSWYGFIREGEGDIRATPFAYYDGAEGGLVIAVPPRWQIRGGAELRVIRQSAAPEGIVLEAGMAGQTGGEDQGGIRRFEISPGTDRFRIPPGLLEGGFAGRSLHLRGEGIAAFYLAAAETPPFPEALSADPGLILEYPQEAWRESRYEIFRWERFPSVLIIDAASYAVQDSLFKRLCFFVEKKGFRGRIAPEEEIRGLHGWNAHDYRAEDLARFFQAAADFPLSSEERELEQILFAEGIIRRENGSIRGGEGAVLSISRESESYLRSLFMAHEGFHGLFFIDEDFRAFSRRRWAGLSPQARTFIISYFDYQGYDTEDEYLLINEFTAHCLQQPASRASRYFGETLASRLDASPWRRSALPEKDEDSNSWPELGRAFRAEAEAFSEYVNKRWGLSAGRVRDIRVR
jgi:hypothetical protein